MAVACVGILHVGDELREINGLRITPRIAIEQLQRLLREACGSVSMKIVPIPVPNGPCVGVGVDVGPDTTLHSWGLARRLSGGASASASQAQSVENLSVHSTFVRQSQIQSQSQSQASASLGNRSLSQSVRTLCESAPTFLRSLFSYDPLIDNHIPCKQAGLKFDVGAILKVSLSLSRDLVVVTPLDLLLHLLPTRTVCVRRR